MTLNEIFNRFGKAAPHSYYTPIAVIGELVNQHGGQVTIINPPFRSQPRAWHKGWSKKLRIGKLYFYVSNCRMKKRPIRDLMYTGGAEDHCNDNKHKLYERQGGKCPICGQPFEYDKMELHHILPINRFPELGQSIRNGVMLCRKCHKEVHCNPFKNIEMMQKKADELGIDLHDRYDYGRPHYHYPEP